MSFVEALAGSAPLAALPATEGGYYGAPKTGLDPRLVDERGLVHQSLRSALLDRLYAFWEPLYRSPRSWSQAWIAGSAPSFQWREHEDLDLDVLIGVDWLGFFQVNPAWRGTPTSAMAQHMNDELRTRLWGENWPSVGWETTFYVNPQSYDIRDIKPYAAYNLSVERWDVTPVALPNDWSPEKYYPSSWISSVGRDAERAAKLIDRWNYQRSTVLSSVPSSPARISALHQLLAVGREATEFFDLVHSGRKEAFASTGEGYFDFANYRWQASKHAGWNAPLRQIRKLASTAAAQADIEAPSRALISAAAFNRRYSSS